MALLWVDKHRPKSLDEMDYHHDLSARLKKLAAQGNQPHMLFVGPSGAGKSTRVYAMLRELYGPGTDMIKVETKSVAPNPSSPSNTVDIQVVVSNYHLVLTPSDVGNKDRAVVMQLIKEVAAHPPLGNHTFKVVVIEDAGASNPQAQAPLRRTMEKYMKTCRIILMCDSASKIIAPLRSRCCAVRVGAPSNEDVQKVLQKVASAESLQLPPAFAFKVAEKSGRDLRRALLLLESAHAQANQFSKDGILPQEGWDGAIEKVSKKILQEQSPKCAMEVRGMLYELLAACLPPDFILKQLMFRLIADQRDDALKQKAFAAAAHFESTMRQGSKDIFPSGRLSYCASWLTSKPQHSQER
uniref:Replication factor C subunit 3 n=1 Tax=Karenia brevis TaxID=156230 RepID=F8TZM8_KARBR|nr:replication factor C subunit 3 [Karenia brevis]